MASDSPCPSREHIDTASGLPDGTEFRDLLRGRIDIIEYLTAAGGPGGDRSGANSVDNASLGELSADEKSSLQQILMKPSAVLHHQPAASTAASLPPTQTLTVHPPSSSASSSSSQGAHSSGTGSNRNKRPGMFPRMDGVNHMGGLPESPPETDSAAGSAGSPSSGSENSPYSPEYNYHHGQLPSVIHPPVGSGAMGGGGVILGVQDLNLSQLVNPELMASTHHSHAGRISAMSAHHHQVGHNGQLTPTGSDYPYPPPQPTPGSLAPPQVSPPGMGGSACPPSPYILSNSNGHGMEGGGGGGGGYGSDGSLGRKRLRSEGGVPIKRDSMNSPRTSVEEGGYDLDGYHQQCIRFSEFQKENFHSLCDPNGRELQRLGFHVVADKGFNFSSFDTTFVNQKKNHFQVSVHIEAHDPMPPKYVRVNNQLKAISEFRLDFYGVKAEMLSSSVQIKQSQTDRKPVPYEPVRLDLPASRVTKVTVARLHFSETTMNNQRKNGRPNPDQKYFYLVVSLNAKLQDGEEVIVVSYASEKVIVRKGQIPNSIYHMGSVGVGTDRPHAPLTVTGDIACTGQFLHPSDIKFKQNVEEVNYREALSRLSQIRIVQYEIRPEVAERWGLEEKERQRVGVIAQELEHIIPDAVKYVEADDDEDGDHLEVDDSRLFYESAAAVKELCRLTGNLEYKIEEVEKISRKLAKFSKLKRHHSMQSTASSQASKASSGISSNYQGSFLSCSRSTLGSLSPAPSRNTKTKEGVENAAGPHVRYSAGHPRNPPPGGHRHCHHYCRRNDRGLCSNKIIQSTIIVLVIVMAFCLIAMATLYILDWNKRNRDAFTTGSPNPSTTFDTGGSETPSANISNSSGPGKMEVPHLTTQHPSSKPDRPSPWLWNRNWPGGTPPPQLKPPCTTLDCPQFCCPNIFSYNAHEESNGKPVHQDKDWQLRLLPKTSAVGDNFHKTQGQAEGQKQTDYSVVQDKTDRLRSRRWAHSMSGEAERWGQTSISILGHNMTIGPQNCLRNSCNKKNKNFTFYIPVSHYLPYLPLEVEFRVENKQYVEFCGPDYGEVCTGADKEGDLEGKGGVHSDGNNKEEDVQEKHSNVFELPVGVYMVSSYRFRVGHSTTSCQESYDMVGETFEEYTLVFYRVCS